MRNIDRLLEEAGARLEEVCKIVIYLTDIRYREAVYQVVGRWLKGVHPVSTGLVVSALARPEWLVEIDATAVISSDVDRRLDELAALHGGPGADRERGRAARWLEDGACRARRVAGAATTSATSSGALAASAPSCW